MRTLRHMMATIMACTIMLLTGALASGQAQARAVTYNLNIPAQDLNAALQQLALAANHKLLYRSELVAGKTSEAIRGSFTAAEAVEKLLAGTELTFEITPAAVVLIKRNELLPGEKLPPAGEATPLSHQGGRAGGGDGFWQRFRLAQAESAVSAQAGNQQTSDDNSSENSQRRIALEEVVVTAQKREERLQDVPVSISVLTGEELDRSTTQGITEALSRVPGVATNVSPQGGGTLVTVRGVTASEPLFNGSNPIAYYLDAVPFGLVDSAIAADTSAYDLQRVEVLRGPQGTLYGASALNGVVRVLTRDADLDELEFKARTSASSTEDGGENYRADMAFNMPISPSVLAVRAVLGYQDFSGWIERPDDEDANDSQIANARLKINAQPTDKLSIALSTWLSRQDYGAPSIANDAGETFHLVDEATSTDYDAHGLKVGYEFPAFSLSSMTSYLDYENRGRLDFIDFFGFSTLLTQDLEASVFSQEINLASAAGGPWRWTAGAIYRDGSNQTIQALPDFLFTLDWTTTSRSYAVFGELTRRFWDGKLEATLGARYFHDDVTVKEDRLAPPLIPPEYYREQESFKATTPRAVLTWRPAEKVTLYGSYSEGFRSGAPQAYYIRTVGIPEAAAPTEPDELRSYEIGTKAQLLDDHLSLDAAIYYMDWEGVHQVLAVPVQGVCCVGALVNGPSASGLGFDLGLTARPLRGLELGVSFSSNDLTFDTAAVSNQVVRFPEGARLNFSPEETLGAFADYVFPIGSRGLEVRLSASANYTSVQSWRGLGTTIADTDSSLIAGTSLAIQAPNWTLTAFADNVGNEDGRIYANPADVNPLDPATAARVRPRTIGLQIEFHL